MVAREKTVDSLPQSRQETFKKLLAIGSTSPVHQFKLLCTLAGGVVSLAGFGASVEDVDALCWLLATVRFGTWETTVTRHDTTETALTPAKLGSAAFLDALHGVHGVLARRGAVSLNLTGTLHHVNTLAFTPHGSGIYALRRAYRPERSHCVPLFKMDYKAVTPARCMEELSLALFFFWLPGVVIVAGLILALLSKTASIRRVAAVVTGASLLLVLSTPWTVPSSPSSAFGHFVGSVLGPCVLLAVGLHNVGFSGNVPVGRLSNNDRNAGIVMLTIGGGWLLAMHWGPLTPTYPSQVNGYWLVFWSTVVLVTPGVGAGLVVLVRTFGDQRRAEQRMLGMLALSLLLVGLAGLTVDGPTLSSSVFADALWLAAADVFGMVVGLGAATVVLALVLVMYERQMTPPPVASGPSERDLERVTNILQSNLPGGDSDRD